MMVSAFMIKKNNNTPIFHKIYPLTHQEATKYGVSTMMMKTQCGQEQCEMEYPTTTHTSSLSPKPCCLPLTTFHAKWKTVNIIYGLVQMGMEFIKQILMGILRLSKRAKNSFSNKIICMHVDAQNRIWIGTYLDGFGYYQNNCFHQQPFLINFQGILSTTAYGVSLKTTKEISIQAT